MKFDFTQQIKEKSNSELTEIFINAKKYNPDFVRLAELELNSRNINLDISKRIKEENKQISNEQLNEGKPGSPLYILLCFVLALLGGILAIYAGYIYRKSKTINTEGQEFYVYNEQTRELGKIMMWLGLAVFLFFFVQANIFQIIPGSFNFIKSQIIKDHWELFAGTTWYYKITSRRPLFTQFHDLRSL